MSNVSDTCVPGSSVPHVEVNTSAYTHILSPTSPKVYEAWEIAVKIIFYVVPFLLNIVCNTIVIIIIILNRKMRTNINIFLINLAVCDLFVAVFCIPTHLGNQITPEWPFGKFVCEFSFFVQVSVLVSSVLTLTVISMERFNAVVYPFRRKWSSSVTKTIIIWVWIFSIIIACPQLIVRHLFEFQWKDRHQVWCQQVWPKVYKDKQCNIYEPCKIAYYCIQSIVMFFVPLVINVVAYSIVYYTIAKSNKVISKSAFVTNYGGRERSKRRTIKMLIAIDIIFILCWTPQQILLLLDIFRSRKSQVSDMDTVSYVALYLAFLNSAINPILYAGFNNNFRRVFKDLFLGKSGDIPEILEDTEDSPFDDIAPDREMADNSPNVFRVENEVRLKEQNLPTTSAHGTFYKRIKSIF